MHKDYSGRTISSFPRLTSTFAAKAPGTGTYNVAYDLWLNGVPNDEVMIWTDNHQQVPAGSRFSAGVSLSGYTWDVYATRDNGYVAFVPSNGARLTSGTLDLKAMLKYLVDRGRVAPNATVDQICYGVELVDTGGLPATWRFTEILDHRLLSLRPETSRMPRARHNPCLFSRVAQPCQSWGRCHSRAMTQCTDQPSSDAGPGPTAFQRICYAGDCGLVANTRATGTLAWNVGCA